MKQSAPYYTAIDNQETNRKLKTWKFHATVFFYKQSPSCPEWNTCTHSLQLAPKEKRRSPFYTFPPFCLHMCYIEQNECIRAGEFAKKFSQVVQTWHMGLKNVPKKFGTPGPNLAPNLFGLFGQGQITKAGTPKWTRRTQWIWIYVKIIYNYLNFSLSRACY